MTTRQLSVAGDQAAHPLSVPLDRAEDLLDVETEGASLPIVLATVEGLYLRPRVPTLFHFPIVRGHDDWVYGCPCGFLSREHGTAERAAKEVCPLCAELTLSRSRRRYYLARLGVRPVQPALSTSPGEGVSDHG